MIGTNDNGLCRGKDCAGTCGCAAQSMKNENPVTARVSGAKQCQWTVPRKDCAEAPHDLQAIDFKIKKDCADRAPLKGGRDSGTIPEISPLSRESGKEENPPFPGTKRDRA